MELTKKERKWIIVQIEISLDSYRHYSNHEKGLSFKGRFDGNLLKKERDIMESIYKKLKNDS